MNGSHGLDRDGLDTAFPFHFFVDRDGIVQQHGPSLSRISRDLVPGACADELLRLVRPAMPFRAAELMSTAPEFVVIEAAGSNFVLRGQTLLQGELLLFIGSPWLTAPHQLEEHQLHFGDFALHDPVVDYLSLLETKNAAFADASRFSQASLQATARLSALITRLPYGVLTESEDGKVALTNESFCRMFGITAPPEALVGVDCMQAAEQSKELFADPDAFMDGIQQRARERVAVSGEVLELRDGRVFERYYAPIFDGQQHRGQLWQYRDVTDLRRAERELVAARARAEEASEAKGRFLAMMSHEMRTPLGVIVGLADLLSEPLEECDRYDYLGRLRSNSSALLRLIDEVLDFSRLEAGHVELLLKPFDPCGLIADVAGTMSLRALEKGIDLRVHDTVGPVGHLLGDEGRLRQILVNFVNNAIKFTEQGHVELAVSCVSSEDHGVRLRYAVSDTGRGIPAHLHEGIFERFVQVDTAAAPRAEGTGLGLSICRALVEKMGSRIELVSEPGRGSCFAFEVEHGRPVSDSAQASAPRASRAPARSAGKILLAEDDPDNREVTRRMLTRAGYSVDIAVDGSVAYERVRAFDYDLLLTDVQMPILDGLELTQRIRELEGSTLRPRLPIVAVTAHAVDMYRNLGVALGMDAYLTKPIRWDDLLKAVEMHIDRRPRVLLVDDSADSQLVTYRHLTSSGRVRVMTVSDGESAVLCAKRTAIDLVMLDASMPGMGGAAAARAIRQLPLAKQPAIVALTGHGPGPEVDELMIAGCNAYLQKPISRARLEEVVQSYTIQPAGHSTGGTVTVEGPGDNLQFDEDMLDLVPGYLANRRADISRLRLLLREDEGKPAMVAIGHQLKGSGKAYGMPEISELGMRLEQLAGTGERNEIVDLVDRFERYVADVEQRLKTRTALRPTR